MLDSSFKVTRIKGGEGMRKTKIAKKVEELVSIVVNYCEKGCVRRYDTLNKTIHIDACFSCILSEVIDRLNVYGCTLGSTYDTMSDKELKTVCFAILKILSSHCSACSFFLKDEGKVLCNTCIVRKVTNLLEG